MEQHKALDGKFKAVLYEKKADGSKGAIIKESPWTPNTITDVWKMRTLVMAKMTGSPGVALRGTSRPATGQFVGTSVSGNFGVYAMGEALAVKKTDWIPPYVDRDHLTLKDVVFHNVNNATAETNDVMIAVDNRSRYSYHPDKAEFTMTFVKNIGEGIVKGVCVGRDFGVRESHHGYWLGESIPGSQNTGTTNYFLEHRMDRTLVWKTVSASSQFSFDFLTKQITAFTQTNLNTNIANGNLTGGLVIGNTVVKAVRQTNTVDGTTVRLHGCSDFQTLATTVTRDIVFGKDLGHDEGEGPSLNTVRACHPILVARPDLAAFEVFMPLHIKEGKCELWRVRVTNFQSGLNDANTVVSDPVKVAEIPYVVSAWDANAVTNYVTGYYHMATQQYYFPYQQYVNADNTLSQTATANYQPGVVYDFAKADEPVLVDEYLARSSSNNVHLPCLTDQGILQPAVNTTTMHYFYGSGVISGANFEEPYEKTVGNILEIIYKYSFE